MGWVNSVEIVCKHERKNTTKESRNKRENKRSAGKRLKRSLKLKDARGHLVHEISNSKDGITPKGFGNIYSEQKRIIVNKKE